MARQNNPRNLRSTAQAIPMFSLYCAKKEAIESWTKSLQGANSTFSFFSKIYQKKKKNNKKKSLINLARSTVLSSSYSDTIMPLFSKAGTMQVGVQLNKLKTNKKKARKSYI